MNIIIDTHIFLWSVSEPQKLSPLKTDILKTPTNTIFVSSITFIEIMIKVSIGKLKIDFDPIETAKESGFQILDFSAEDSLALQDMPFHHKDPFDRMLISQSINRDYYLMSDDGKFGDYDLKLI
ncbi:MAG TPA: type II toxin-antitoxin system VapC family toxin [Campylobacterales bacterium]|nr:type II toxin-antitoxin system VapC family toxin [Campylobacterales bacterium]